LSSLEIGYGEKKVKLAVNELKDKEGERKWSRDRAFPWLFI
jgi:hypothetical protein